MNVRISTIEDLNLILDIYAKARAFMKSTGNPNQWNKLRKGNKRYADGEGRNKTVLVYKWYECLCRKYM